MLLLIDTRDYNTVNHVQLFEGLTGQLGKARQIYTCTYDQLTTLQILFEEEASTVLSLSPKRGYLNTFTKADYFVVDPLNQAEYIKSLTSISQIKDPTVILLVEDQSLAILELQAVPNVLSLYKNKIEELLNSTIRPFLTTDIHILGAISQSTKDFIKTEILKANQHITFHLDLTIPGFSIDAFVEEVKDLIIEEPFSCSIRVTTDTSTPVKELKLPYSIDRLVIQDNCEILYSTDPHIITINRTNIDTIWNDLISRLAVHESPIVLDIQCDTDASLEDAQAYLAQVQALIQTIESRGCRAHIKQKIFDPTTHMYVEDSKITTNYFTKIFEIDQTQDWLKNLFLKIRADINKECDTSNMNNILALLEMLDLHLSLKDILSIDTINNSVVFQMINNYK